jgi:phosphohistidine swiveling domain-containing protein
MSFLAALDAADAPLGGKARSLARLAAAGLATPPGFVITDALFRAICPRAFAATAFDDAALSALDQLRRDIEKAPWPDGFPEELAARLRGLGTDRFAVRSSFASEDVLGALAAGVYASLVDVPLAEVESALRHVLCSAVSPGAAAYALAHGRNPADPPVAVVVHAYVSGAAEGSAAFAPGATPEPVLMVRHGSLTAGAEAELRASLERLAQTLGPLEVEWVLAAKGLVYLQERPFQAKMAPAEWQGWKDLPKSAGDRSAWRWDVAHNPLPLSPAQVGLVEFVDEGCRIGIRQRVLGGYLFYANDARALPSPIEPATAAGYFEALRADFEAHLAGLGPAPSLEAALALFASVYERIFGVLQPALKRTRRELQGFLRDHAPAGLPLLAALGAGVPSMAEERRRLAAAIRQADTDPDRARARAAYLLSFGDEAPIWDVSAPTYAEDPAPLLLAHGAASPQAQPVDWRAPNSDVERRLANSERDLWRGLLARAREAISLSEADDWLYARAQAVVRRALLATGHHLAKEGRLSDAREVFQLPLPLVRALASGSGTVGDLGALAAAGRAVTQVARKNPPPVWFSGDDKAVQGHGTGGSAIGHIVVHRSGCSPALPIDAVLLARTLLPTELPLVEAAALITETGGPLDHVAAQARERGIPAVIGAAGASSLLHEGDLVLVDGERGLVVKLARD